MLEYVAFLAGESADGSAAQLTVEGGGRLSVADSLLMQPASVVAQWAQPVPLPCDGGADGGCRGQHVGAVVLAVAASISLAAPLVCGFWTDDCVALPAGVTAEQHAAGLTAGIPRKADAVCFLYGVDRLVVLDPLVVPGDPNYLVSTGQCRERTPTTVSTTTRACRRPGAATPPRARSLSTTTPKATAPSDSTGAAWDRARGIDCPPASACHLRRQAGTTAAPTLLAGCPGGRPAPRASQPNNSPPRRTAHCHRQSAVGRDLVFRLRRERQLLLRHHSPGGVVRDVCAVGSAAGTERLRPLLRLLPGA